MPKVLKEEIIRVERLAPGICLMSVRSEYIAREARPGQFVNIKCCEGLNALLRRPISICNTDREQGTFDIAFQEKGSGTAFLAQKKAGDFLDVVGALGTPFCKPPKDGKIAVVGGGIGVFPLLFLLKEFREAAADTFLGYRSREFVVLENEFKQISDFVMISTDDGSAGYQGLITEVFEESVRKKGYDRIYACGPVPMLKKVVETSERHQIQCQVSLEQRMGCGIGACLVCACKTKKGDGWQYSHVCKDGPVFWGNEVIFEDM